MRNLLTTITCGLKRLKCEAGEFKDNNKGVGVVEVILILVVLIGLVVIFRDQLTSIINGIFERIVNDSNAI